MGRTSFRRVVVPLLIALLTGGSAAAPVATRYLRDVRDAIARGDVVTAERLTNESLSKIAGSDDDAAWELRVLRGQFMVSTSPNEARVWLESLKLPRRLAQSAIAARRLVLLASVCYRNGDNPAAIRYLDLADPIVRRHQPQLLIEMLYTRATIVPPVDGVVFAREAWRLAQQQSDRSLTVKAGGTLGYLYGRLDRYDEAIPLWRSLLPVARAARHPMQDRIEGNIGWAYAVLGDFDTAAGLFQHAAESARKIGSVYSQVIWVDNLGNVRRYHRDWIGAEQHYRRAIELGRQTNHPDLGSTYANLGVVLMEMGKYADARQATADGRAWAQAKKRRDQELATDIVDARLDMAEGKFASAEKRLRHVVASSDSSFVLSQVHGHLGTLYARSKDSRRAQAEFRLALDAARHARQNITDVTMRLPFFTAVADLFDAYVEFLVNDGRSEEALAVTDIARAATLEEAIGVVGTARDARAVAKKTNATLLCYWLGRKRSHLWIVTPSSIDRMDLPADTIVNNAVDAYQRELMGPAVSVKSARGQGLHRMLIGPVASRLGKNARIIVVPDGRLHAFNMETLIVPSPSPHYWIEDAIVSNAASLQLLAGRKAAPSAAAPRALLLVGNPNAADPAFPPLARAKYEMERVSRHFDPKRTTILDASQATPAAYAKSSPRSFELIHFVAHATAIQAPPLDSAVILSRGGDGYKLYARDVIKHPLRARLVTLSSCHGAGKRAYAGEGLVGLSWAFLRAGAKDVIAALWEVNDRATPDLMDQLYAGIREGKDPAIALREAKLRYVRSNPVYRKPLYWAPFVLYSGS